MALTAHKIVAMFMRYIRTENDLIRHAAELVGQRRKTVVGMVGGLSATTSGLDAAT